MIVRPFNRPLAPGTVHVPSLEFRRQSRFQRVHRYGAVGRVKKTSRRRYIRITLPSTRFAKPRVDLRCYGHSEIPPSRGLFNPENDKDSCGVGFIGELTKRPSRRCVEDAIEMLRRMTHRGACGCEENTGLYFNPISPY